MKCKRLLSWLWSHCLSNIKLYIKQCIFLQFEREEGVERRIQEIGNKSGKLRGLRRNDESNEKLKDNNTERNTLTETSKEMERKMIVIQRCRHRHIHTEVEREQ